MSKTKRHYTADDLHEALENQRAELVIWRCDALRELRACLRQDLFRFRQDLVSGTDGAAQ